MKASVTRLGTAVHNLGLRAIHKRVGGGVVKSSSLGVGVGVTWLGQLMGWTDNSSDYDSLCTTNCSGHGECMNGTCFCQVQFEGVRCSEPNVSYHVGFASVFLLVAATSLIQLFICIHAEYARMKAPSILKACRITNQKFLYILVFLAALLRGLYFAYPGSTDQWSSSMLSAYYPVLLTGASLIVCFWAEVFHMQNVQERPPFLSKSFLGFLAFNVITYSLLIAELVITNTQIHTEEDKSFFSHVFNGCYALLMFIVVIFFLIYGVEVYFKVRGGFLNDCDFVTSPLINKSFMSTATSPCLSSSASPSSATPNARDKNQEVDKDVTTRLMKEETVNAPLKVNFMQSIDMAQLHQSRLGLISQAVMLIITVCFLLSEILGEFWKKKVDLVSRNTFDVVFRVVELGVALWFPCVLWNCIRPEQLWILNPTKILKRLDITPALEITEKTSRSAEAAPVKNLDNDWDKKDECWICYDNERTDAGPVIQPCNCKGDVGAVHHECLKRWLIECASNPSALICKVCQTSYQVETKTKAWSQLNLALSPRHRIQIAGLVAVMCAAIGGAITVIKFYQDSGLRLLAVGVALLIVYICCRFLGLNTVLAYQRCKVSTFNIVSHRPPSETENLPPVTEEKLMKEAACIKAEDPASSPSSEKTQF